MNVSAVFSPPLTPPAASSALVAANKVENSAKIGLATASSAVLPSISSVAQTANQAAENDISNRGGGGGSTTLNPPAALPARLNFSPHNEIAPAAKG